LSVRVGAARRVRYSSVGPHSTASVTARHSACLSAGRTPARPRHDLAATITPTVVASLTLSHAHAVDLLRRHACAYALRHVSKDSSCGACGLDWCCSTSLASGGSWRLHQCATDSGETPAVLACQMQFFACAVETVAHQRRAGVSCVGCDCRMRFPRCYIAAGCSIRDGDEGERKASERYRLRPGDRMQL
jgi:hypothetical protein